MTTPYPEEHYRADKLFQGHGFAPEGQWGGLTDGPTDYDGLIEAIRSGFAQEPTLDTLRVYQFTQDRGVFDVTEEVGADLAALWNLEETT